MIGVLLGDLGGYSPLGRKLVIQTLGHREALNLVSSQAEWSIRCMLKALPHLASGHTGQPSESFTHIVP